MLLFVDAFSWWLVEERRRERCEGGFILCLGSVAACLWFYSCVQVMDIIDRLLFSLSVKAKEQYFRLEGELVVGHARHQSSCEHNTASLRKET